MLRIALLIEYEGTKYSGWQSQPNGVTIQSTLEQALEKVTQQAVRILGSGRTDAGVHAAGQVAHLDLMRDLSMPIERFPGAINTQLPNSIRVLAAQVVPAQFSARFQAIAREYQYTITIQPRALNRKLSWFCKYKLNPDDLNRCARLILGEHDFTSFCASISDTENKVCHVSESVWLADANYLIYKISGTRFLHHMVRMLVGTMVEVGRGRWKFDQFQRLLDEPTQDHHKVTAPARGLVLKRVRYPESLTLFREYYGE